jgi:dihydroflavonol-4-reductase
MTEILVTGGAGFIGRSVVRQLVARGDRVRVIVHDPARAKAIADLGVELRHDDLSRTAEIADAMRGCKSVIHLAADYRLGIAASDRPAMLEDNVGATTRMLDAAAIAGADRIVHVSTINVFGNTHGRIVDESHRRDLAEGFLSYYDETKFIAHRAVLERIGGGARAVVVMPGAVYGPDDESLMGARLLAAHRGTARTIAAGDTGISAVYVEDVASGIVAALDRGRDGESYVLAGENLRLADAMVTAARVGGQAPPRLSIPNGLVRLAALTPAWLARLAGQPDNLAELARTSLGVTLWASSAKAATELDYRPHDLQTGLRAAFGDG